MTHFLQSLTVTIWQAIGLVFGLGVLLFFICASLIRSPGMVWDDYDERSGC